MEQWKRIAKEILKRQATRVAGSQIKNDPKVFDCAVVTYQFCNVGTLDSHTRPRGRYDIDAFMECMSKVAYLRTVAPYRRLPIVGRVAEWFFSYCNWKQHAFEMFFEVTEFDLKMRNDQ